VQSLGVLRAYHTRHGNGPFVTESDELTSELVDATNKEHRWQGSFRVGHFDMVAARYAIASCRGALDGLVITCLDRLRPGLGWRFCEAYDVPRAADIESLFELKAGVAVGITVAATPDIKRQERLGEVLKLCKPRLVEQNLFPAHADTIRAAALEENLGLPIAAVSVGETEADKIEI
jgi:adenylosuccinate synthase